MKRKISVTNAVLLVLLAVVLTCTVTLFFSQDIYERFLMYGSAKMRMYQKVSAIYDHIEKDFLYDVDESAMTDYIGIGMVSALDDQYANYYNKEDFQTRMDSDKGKFAGIGAQVLYDQESNRILLQSVYPDSPAEQSGLLKGDAITAIDGKDLKELGSETSTSLMRGEEGTTIVLTVERDGVKDDYSLIRREVEIPCVQSRMIGEQGYIKILTFNSATFPQFQEAVGDLQTAGAKGLVFDLRDDGGGVLDAVLDMLDYLLPKGELGSTVSKDGSKKVMRTSDANEINLPMVTITNEKTASASELFVMALKDFGKAPSVGTKTFGKGIVQNTYTLPDGTAVKFTTDYFNPPKSENFNGKGIVPDYEVTLTEEQQSKLDSLDESNDPQLQKALEVLGQ